LGTRDVGIGQMSLYVDGLVDAESSGSVPQSALLNDDGSPDPFLIGAQAADGVNVFTNFFNGLIDEVTFFNRALTSAEVQTIPSAGGAGLCTTGADLQVPQSDAGHDPVVLGTNTAYAVTITNNGPATASGVTLTEFVPAGASFVGYSSIFGVSCPAVVNG